MDLEKYIELSDLNERIYDLKLKNARFEVQREIFEQISPIDNELVKLNFAQDFIVLISQNLKKISALTLTLMNQSEETNSSNNIFKLKKELKSVLIEYLRRIINFTLKDEQELSETRGDMQLEQKINADEISPVYEFIIKKLDNGLIKDENERKMLNEIANDFQKILDQLERFNKIWSK